MSWLDAIEVLKFEFDRISKERDEACVERDTACTGRADAEQGWEDSASAWREVQAVIPGRNGTLLRRTLDHIAFLTAEVERLRAAQPVLPDVGPVTRDMDGTIQCDGYDFVDSDLPENPTTLRQVAARTLAVAAFLDGEQADITTAGDEQGAVQRCPATVLHCGHLHPCITQGEHERHDTGWGMTWGPFDPPATADEVHVVDAVLNDDNIDEGADTIQIARRIVGDLTAHRAPQIGEGV